MAPSNMQQFLFILLTLNLNAALAFRSPRQLCQKSSEARASCENIYVWSQKTDDFVSLLNVSLLKSNLNDLDALAGRNVQVIADNMLPYITSSNYSQHLGGYLGDIWAVIQSALKFKTNVSSIYYDTGLQLIEAGRADVMLAAVVVKKGLLNVVYSQPYFYNWYNLFIKRPEAKASSASYLKTFNAQLWWFTGAVFVILTLSVWLTSKFLNRAAYRLEPSISIPSCFLGIVSGFINQGFDLKLNSYSARIQIFFALILGVVLMSAMNAVLVAKLAVFETPFPFESLYDIASKGSHALCMRSSSFVYNNFTDENHEPLPEWRQTLNAKPCLDINKQSNIPKILCKNRLVILENRVVMATVLKEHVLPCSILSFSRRYFAKSNSFLLSKGFTGKRLIDTMVKKMRSTGVLQRLENKWVQREKEVEIYAPKSPEVGIQHIGGVLSMYLLLILFSVFVLLIEICCHKHRDHKQRKYISPTTVIKYKQNIFKPSSMITLPFASKR